LTGTLQNIRSLHVTMTFKSRLWSEINKLFCWIVFVNKMHTQNYLQKSDWNMNFFHFYSCHQICFNFFCVHFLKTFSTDLKSAYNSAFLIPFLAKKRSKILKAYFVKCVLDFSFSPIIGVWVLNFSCSSKKKFVVPYCTDSTILFDRPSQMASPFPSRII
jgi:hypothetical protein